VHPLAEIEAAPVEPDSLSQLADAIEGKLLDGDEDASSRTNERQCLRLIIATFRAIFSGDYARLENLLTDNAEFTVYGPEEMPMVGRVVGWQAIIQRVIENFSGVSDQKVEVIDAIGQDDRIAILFHETGRLCATGKTYDIYFTQWFRFRDGRVACIRQVTDTFTLCSASSHS
jgi:ketosteroid isomerase-like protein